MSAWRGRGPGSDIDEGDEGARSSDRSPVNDDDDDANDSDSSDEDLSQKFPHHALPKHGKNIYVDKAFSETSSHSSRNARQSRNIGKRKSHNGNNGNNYGADRNAAGTSANRKSGQYQHSGGGYHDNNYQINRTSPHADDDDEDSADNLGSEITGSFSGDEESFNSDSQSATSSLTEGTGFASVRSSGRGTASVSGLYLFDMSVLAVVLDMSFDFVSSQN